MKALPLRRDEELSRRILASLAFGGKLPDEESEIPESFVVPVRNVYSYAGEAMGGGGGGSARGHERTKAGPGAPGLMEEKIIRRRLGLG